MTKNSTVHERLNLGKLFDLAYDAMNARDHLRQQQILAQKPQMSFKGDVLGSNGFARIENEGTRRHGEFGRNAAFNKISIRRLDREGLYDIFLSDKMMEDTKGYLPDTFKDPLRALMIGQATIPYIGKVVVASTKDRYLLNSPAICIEYHASLKKDLIERFDVFAGFMVRQRGQRFGNDYKFFSDDVRQYSLHREDRFVHREGVHGMQLTDKEEKLSADVSGLLEYKINPALDQYAAIVKEEISFIMEGGNWSFREMF